MASATEDNRNAVADNDTEDGITTPDTIVHNTSEASVNDTSSDDKQGDESQIPESGDLAKTEQDTSPENSDTVAEQNDVSAISETSSEENNSENSTLVETQAASPELGRFVNRLAKLYSTQNGEALSAPDRTQSVNFGFDNIRTYERLRDTLDALKEETASDILFNKTVVGSAVAASVGLSVGYVVWLVRGGMLLASLLSSLPAWQIADPLPILAEKDDDPESEDQESLETMLEDGAQRTNNSDKRKFDRKGPK
jgi:hypothetical protein